MRYWRDEISQPSALASLSDAAASSNVIALPPAVVERTITATFTGDSAALRLVTIGIHLSDDGQSWTTPDDDTSLRLVMVTTQTESVRTLNIAAHWAYAQFFLSSKTGNFKLAMEIK